MEKLRKRLEELNKNSGGGSGSSGGSISYLNVKDGRNEIRILPAAEGKDLPFEEVFVHYGVGKNKDSKGHMVVCPTTHGEDKKCPVCEMARELFDLSTAKDDKYEKQAKSMNRKKRVYYNALDRADDLDNFEKREVEDDSGNKREAWFNIKEDKEETIVKVYNSGVGVLKSVLGFITDPEYGDITHPTEGLDLIVEKSGSGFNTKYDVKTKRKESDIGVDGWEDMLHDLDLFKRALPYEAIERIIDGEDPREVKKDLRKSNRSKDEEENKEEEKEEATSNDTEASDEPEEKEEPKNDTEEDSDEDISKDELMEALRNRRKNKK